MTILFCAIVFIVALRLNSHWERRLQARRILHGLILPLYHYLGLLDHEIQGEVEEINNLYRQAVLDHVTELRAFLLQPDSRDLSLTGKLAWGTQLHNILLSLEAALEAEDDELDEVELKAQVVHLSNFIKNHSYLNGLLKRPLGLVQYSEQ
jgi:hypothetical protein